MKASDALRGTLADRYMGQMDWRQAATVAGLDPSHIAMQGSSFAVWTNILETVRTRNRADGLRTLVSLQQSDLLPLFELYAAELARGDGELTGLPELTDVDLDDADLDMEAVARSLAFEKMLRAGPLRLALALQVPTGDGIDAALRGQRTAAARANLARYLDQQRQTLEPVNKRRSAVKASAEKLDREIAALERDQPPYAPFAPSSVTLSTALPAENAFWERQHAEDVKRFDLLLKQYQAEQSRLPGLRSNAQAAAQELAQLDTAIATISTQTIAGELPFHRAIEDARDQDLVLELGSMLDKAGAAFRREAKPFKGFWMLLAASCMLDFIEKAVIRTASATEARQKFITEAAALAPFVEREVAAITRGCLAGPTVIARALAVNRASTAALAGRIDKLPTAQLAEATRRARATVSAPPEVPAFARLEHPTEIEAMARRLTNLRTVISAQTARLQAELDDNLRREVAHALDDATETINGMSAASEKPAALLDPSRVLWTFIDRCAASGELPAFTRTLCAALSHEFASRAEAKPGVVLDAASATDFSLRDAQALLEMPTLVDYLQSGTELSVNHAATESRGDDIDGALVKIGTQAGKVARKYQVALRWIATLAVVPVVNIIPAIWALRIVGRLKPLVASGDSRYVALRRDASWMMLVASALSVVAGAVTVMVPTVSRVLQSVDGGSLAAAGSCCLALILFVVSLVAALQLRTA